MFSAVCVIILAFLNCMCVCDDTRSIEDENTKGSLAFVIDDTYSMREEIDQVISKTEEIFLAVLESKKSLIDNFVLVAFNDDEDGSPDPIRILANTRDSKVYLNKLREIKVHGGYKCPELSMSGIKGALKECRPFSQIYVFTDASSRDHHLFEEVKRLAQEQFTQITFLLTGDCYANKTQPEQYLVYNKLAKATSGSVFRILEEEITDIIQYIVHQIKTPRTALSEFGFTPGISNLNFTLGNSTKDVSVEVNAKSGKTTLNLTDPDGAKARTKDLVNVKNIKVVKIIDPKPGTYTGTIASETAGFGKVTTSTSITIRHGFSILRPSTIGHTTARPVAGEESYLSIKLDVSEGDADLLFVSILDMEGNLLDSKPVQVINKKDKFYVTQPFVPPDRMFQVQINATKTDTGEKVVMLIRTPIEAEKPPNRKNISFDIAVTDS